MSLRYRFLRMFSLVTSNETARLGFVRKNRTRSTERAPVDGPAGRIYASKPVRVSSAPAGHESCPQRGPTERFVNQMGTVSPLQPPVNPGTKHKVADVIAWVEAQSKKADMGATSARLRITSLKQMYEQVAEDEPHDDVGWLLENMDRMSERWARRNQSSAAATAKDYASRAKNTIQQ